MKLGVLFGLLILAAAEDIQTGRVPNRLIAAGLIAGIVVQAAGHQAWGIYYFLGNISVPVILLYLLFQMRVLGAGDVKLFSMIGGFLTMEELLRCMAYSFAAAGAGAILFLAADKKRWQKLMYAGNYFLDLMHTGRLTPYVPQEDAEKMSFAFSVPILFGTAFAVFHQGG